MKIYELYPCEPINEAVGRVLGRGAKGTLQRKFRCTSGPRKGRVVADPATCTKPIDMAKRIKARQTRQRKAGVASFKRARTLRTSPASKIIKRTNIQRAGQAKKRRTIKGLKR
jgi:hypothetical protein